MSKTTKRKVASKPKKEISDTIEEVEEIEEVNHTELFKTSNLSIAQYCKRNDLDAIDFKKELERNNIKENVKTNKISDTVVEDIEAIQDDEKLEYGDIVIAVNNDNYPWFKPKMRRVFISKHVLIHLQDGGCEYRLEYNSYVEDAVKEGKLIITKKISGAQK